MVSGLHFSLPILDDLLTVLIRICLVGRLSGVFGLGFAYFSGSTVGCPLFVSEPACSQTYQHFDALLEVETNLVGGRFGVR